MAKTLSIQARLILLLLPAVFAITVVSPLVFFGIVGTAIEDSSIRENLLVLKKNSETTRQFVESDKRLILALRDVPPIQGMIRSRKTGLDKQDNSTYEQWSTRLSQIFRAHLKANNSIYQLRVFDEKGNEEVHAELIGGQIVITPPNLLQNKKDRPYFLEAMQLSNDELYVSSVELNQEYGKIEMPYVPVLRIATPVFDSEGKRKGVIMGNFLAGEIFSPLREQSAILENFVVDHGGFFALHPNAEMEFGADLKKPEATIVNEFPTLAPLIRKSKNGNYYDQGTEREFLWETIKYGPNAEQTWTVISSIDRMALVAPIQRLRSIIIAVSTMLAFSIIGLIAYSAHNLSSPIRHLTKAVSAVAAGKIDTVIQENANTAEMAELNQGFKKMQNALNQTYTDMEGRIQERTKDVAYALAKQKQSNLAMLNIMEDLENAKTQLQNEATETKKFQNAVEGSTDAIAITSIEGKIVFVNRAFEILTGYSSEEVVGKNPKILRSNQTKEETYSQMWKAILEGKVFATDDIVNKRKDGTLYNAELTVFPVLKNNKPIYFVGVQRDITQRKNEDRVKSEFISLASHQLRTPLTALRLSLELLSKGRFGPLTEEQENIVQSGLRYAVALAETIHTMLSISRVEVGKASIDATAIHVQEFLREISKELSYSASQKSLQVVVDCPEDIVIHTDKNFLKEIIANLTSNAIRYTPEKGRIEIRALVVENNLKISVQDNGYGIPAEAQERIFQKFFRADNAQKKVPDGTGLGLYLVQSLVSIIGGRISFVSEENKGTTFTLSLPYSPSQS